MSLQPGKQTVEWPLDPNKTDWLQDKPTETWRKKFEEEGYLTFVKVLRGTDHNADKKEKQKCVVDGLLTEDEFKVYKDLTSKMLKGEIDASMHRHDLGNATERKIEDTENICQIMWPSIYVDNLDQGPLHVRAKAIAKIILGQDADFDFDMFLSKAPHTDTETPWHQDESYWPEAEDKRSASCWTIRLPDDQDMLILYRTPGVITVAIDDACVDNGCMWFIPGSHRKGMKEHRRVNDRCHVRMCDVSDDDVKVAAEIKAGSCTFHHGRTLHYTRGNSTDKPRTAYVTIYRPQNMIKAFRERGIDHGKQGLEGTIHGVMQS